MGRNVDICGHAKKRLVERWPDVELSSIKTISDAKKHNGVMYGNKVATFLPPKKVKVITEAKKKAKAKKKEKKKAKKKVKATETLRAIEARDKKKLDAFVLQEANRLKKIKKKTKIKTETVVNLLLKLDAAEISDDKLSLVIEYLQRAQERKKFLAAKSNIESWIIKQLTSSTNT